MLYAGKKYSFSFGRHSLIQILFISWCVQYEGLLADSKLKNYLCFKLVYYGAIFKIFVHMKIFITSCHRFLFSCSYFLIDFQKFSPQDQFVGMLAHSNLQKNSLKGLSILPTNSNSRHVELHTKLVISVLSWLLDIGFVLVSRDGETTLCLLNYLNGAVRLIFSLQFFSNLSTDFYSIRDCSVLYIVHQ